MNVFNMLITLLPLFLILGLVVYAAWRDVRGPGPAAAGGGRPFPVLPFLGSAAGWLVIGVMATIYGILLGAWSMLWIGVRTVSPDGMWNLSSERGSFFIALVCTYLSFLLFCLAVAVLRFGMTGGVGAIWKRRGGIVAVFLALLGWILIDAPPVTDDYGWEDVPTYAKDPEASHKVLMSLRDATIDWKHLFDEMKVGWGFPELETNILAHAEEVQEAWRMIEPGRQVVERLDEFDSVGDLTTDVGNSFTKLFIPLRNLAQQYWVYCHLKVEQGESEEAARQLVKLQSVSRKVLPNARLLISRMMWIAVCGGNIDQAWSTARNPKCSPEAIRILREGFPALGLRETSLRTTVKAAYPFGKAICETRPNVLDFLPTRRFGSDGKEEESPDLLRPVESRIIVALGYRKNRSIRDLKVFNGLLLDGTDRDPPDFTAATGFVEKRIQWPDLGNLSGWAFLFLARPETSYIRAADTTAKTRVKSELLAMELNARLGEKLVLPDYYTGGDYLVDEKTGEFYSKGPDGIAGTKDDVRLGQY